jgi:hypothetical protein
LNTRGRLLSQERASGSRFRLWLGRDNATLTEPRLRWKTEVAFKTVADLHSLAPEARTDVPWGSATTLALAGSARVVPEA